MDAVLAVDQFAEVVEVGTDHLLALLDGQDILGDRVVDPAQDFLVQGLGPALGELERDLDAKPLERRQALLCRVRVGQAIGAVKPVPGRRRKVAQLEGCLLAIVKVDPGALQHHVGHYAERAHLQVQQALVGDQRGIVLLQVAGEHRIQGAIDPVWWIVDRHRGPGPVVVHHAHV